MSNFSRAFFCIFCLMSIGIIGLAAGLRLIDPLLGLFGVISCAVAMFSVSGSITE